MQIISGFAAMVNIQWPLPMDRFDGDCISSEER
jgi:hypothetical protein